MSSKQGAAALSIASNTLLVILKFVAGIMSGSVSIISEAAHSAVDLMASLMAFFSIRAAEAPADAEHPFGHGKIENISALAEAALIFFAAGIIIFEAVKRLPATVKGLHPIEPTIGIAVMAVSAAVNLVISRWLFKVAQKTDSIALAADAAHLQTDVWTSAGVFVGLVAISITGVAVIDPIIAIAVALLIVRAAYRLVMESGGPLVDVRLPRHEIKKVSDILLSEPKIVGYHKLRTRKAGAERHIDVHIIVSESMSLSEAHDLTEVVEEKMRQALGGANVITHVEPVSKDAAPYNPAETPAESKNHSEE